ncbi:MAG: LD-carboxypeptidase [Armatimonadetes bacterium]|nr:LD-carboxypeptidase [Armatimonadota bacterium]
MKLSALRPGDTIGLIAPASPPDPAKLERGIACLEARGYRVKTAPHLSDRRGYLAGSDPDRAADMAAMFADPEVRAVFCARGGYGSIRLLEHLDYPAIAAHPKIFLGYSDITSLHLSLRRECGFPTFHGPMPAAEMPSLDAFAGQSLWDALTDTPVPRQLAFDSGRAAPYTLVGGSAEGPLVGGCLCLVASSLGTPWEIETSGHILFLEDLHEEPWRVDRMLTQLKLAGKLEEAAGFLLGHFPHPSPESPEPFLGLDDIYTDILAPFGKPALCAYPIGHVDHPLTLPVGCRARLDADDCALTILESAVR